MDAAPFWAAATAASRVPAFSKTSAAGRSASHIVRLPTLAPPHSEIAPANATNASFQAASASASLQSPAWALTASRMDFSAALRPRL